MRWIMPDPVALRPATPDEIAAALSRALLYDHKGRGHHADTMMTQITADGLVRHLAAAGFVVMKKSGTVAPSTSGMLAPRT